VQSSPDFSLIGYTRPVIDQETWKQRTGVPSLPAKKIPILTVEVQNNFNDLNPGLALDRVVAIIVLGWKEEPSRWWSLPSGEITDRLPSFSTELQHAWVIVDRLLPFLSEPDAGDGEFFLHYFEAEPEDLPCTAPRRRDYSPLNSHWAAHFHLW
jgi:hypothetical protein